MPFNNQDTIICLVGRHCYILHPVVLSARYGGGCVARNTDAD